MPVERVSQTFKDISSSFEVNPLNEDLIAIKNETAIARSVRNIVFTLPGEKFFDEDFGSRISASLFENIDELTASEISDQIKITVENFEPRVILTNVEVSPDYDNGEFNVTINYDIVGIDLLPQQLQFALQPTR